MSDIGSSEGRRVLIVEDEVLIGMLLEEMLGDLGFEIAANAARLEDAVTVAKTADVDVAILDVNLDRGDTSSVAEILQARGIPFVFATGYGARGLPSGFGHCPTLQKPFQMDALEQELRKLLSAPRGDTDLNPRES